MTAPPPPHAPPSPPPAAATPPAAGRRRLRDTDQPNFTTWLGTERMRMQDGECEVRLQVGAHHRNLGGVVHGGVTASLLDTCMGGAVVSTLGEDEWCGTAELSLKYLRWGNGPVLRASARIVKRGRALAFVEGVVVDEGQREPATGAPREVARATGTWFVWREAERGVPGPADGA